MRPPFAPYEMDLHRLVEQALTQGGLTYAHEARIAPGCRIDFLVDAVGIEIKKGKPSTTVLMRQLLRYTSCDAVSGLILVSQRSVKLPATVAGKPLRVLSLPQLWGVSLP